MDGDKLKFYLERVGESSRRSRVVFYLILISSLMTFAFDWKMADWGWLHKRIEARHELLNHWEDLSARKPLPAGVTEEAWEDWQAVLKKRDMAGMTTEDKKILEMELGTLEEQWNSPFKVPFMDVTFDINDFLFFSTLELLILAVVFLHCIVREEENLQMFFSQVEKEGRAKLKECYEMASMLQLWTVPRGLDRATEFTLRLSLWPIFFFPVLVEAWAYVDDQTNSGWWALLSKPFGNWMRFCDHLLLLMLFFVTAWSGWYFVRMNKCWDDIQRKIAR